MINQEIYDLIDRFERSSLYSLKLSSENQCIELTKESKTAPACVQTETQEAVSASSKPKSELPAITSPLVGTFYTAPGPNEPAFVSVGDHVKKGQTVCLIEAMKMMSEIPAPCDGIITEVVKENGELAAFGEALFRYQVV